ncbi:RICIN domain-containing protein [Longispora sp. K20-0274]|uniref:ricin-type beta-trefoil lectin domain protein n=1 Tax=Longispora sp. K20-0274 TaxID=3088255 RepID=UPI0039995D13
MLRRVAPLAIVFALAVPAPALADGPRAHYVDCSAAVGGDGSAGTPWNALAPVNAHGFGAGDQLLFRRGTTCVGTLAPTGAGAAGAPVTVDAYGTGAAPQIAGNGAPNAVYLRNTAYWELRNLEITNTGAAAGNRRGVLVELEDYGTAHHFVLANLNVHDVNGDDKKDIGGSGGIEFWVKGTVTPTKFDDVQLLDNTVTKVDRSGMFFVSTWNRSGFEAQSAGVFVPWTGVVIRGNTVTDTGGDGIVPGNTVDALIEHNRINGFQKRSAGYNAGLWTYDSDRAVFQYNEVSGGQTTRDGMGLDVDQGTIGVVFQYNYTHDNAGGFLLLCNATGILRDAVVRYNLSVNDSYRGVENCSGTIESASVHHNTIYIGPGISQTVVNENNTTRRNVTFSNNVVLKQGSGTASFTLRGGGYVLDRNLVSGGTAPTGGTNTLTSDPLLVAPGSTAAADYRLRTGSPALGSGTTVPGDTADYFGGAVTASRGFHAGPGVAAPATGPIRGVASGRCVDVPGSVTTDGTPLVLWDCHGGANQAWNRPGDGTLRALGKCATVAGSNVVLSACTGAATQQWTVTGPTVTNAGLCLDANGGGTANNTKVIVWACHGGANQQWTVG